MKKPSKTAAELEASIKVEMEDICDCLPILTISIQPDGDSWKVKVVQEGSVDDTDRREMVEQIAARLVESESTFDYFTATRAYLERYGKPVAFYSDKHGVFRVNRKDAIGGDGMTQFGRALHALNIDIICANSSQAKGRVERANGTLQDRLVKQMRLSGIDTIAAGNAFLPAFMEQYNARFAKAPFDDRDVHRTLVAGHDDLDDAFAWKEERTVSMNLTLQYDQVLFILEPTGITRSLARSGSR
jgi:hypothetical protein